MKKELTHNFYNRPFFRADVLPDGTLELLCYDEIGENSWTGDGVTAKAIKAQLDAAPTCSDVLLRINSPGGDPFEAIAIYNLLRSQGKPIEVRIDGLAASSASLLAMCGSKIIMGGSAMLMVHNAFSFCVGYASDMRQMAAQLDKVSGQIAAIYVKRTKRPAADIAALMDAESWLTAQEALDAGFATQIEQPDEQIAANARIVARHFHLLDRFSNVPGEFRAAAAEGECGCECRACIDGDCDQCTNAECEDKNCLDCPMQLTSLSDLEASLDTLDLALKF